MISINVKRGVLRFVVVLSLSGCRGIMGYPRPSVLRLPSAVSSFLANALVSLAVKDEERPSIGVHEALVRDVASGLVGVDPTERMPLSPGGHPLPLACLLGLSLPKVVDPSEMVKPGTGPIPGGVQKMLLDWVYRGNLSPNEMRDVAELALYRGAQDAFLELSAHWDKQERIDWLSAEGQCYADNSLVPFVFAAAHAGLNKIVLAAIDDGLDVNIQTHDGNTLAHLASTPELLEDLWARGIDPGLRNRDGHLAPAHWEKKRQGNDRAVLVEKWNGLAANALGPEGAHRVRVQSFFSGLGARPRVQTENQLRELGMKPWDMVDGKSLIWHAARDLLLTGARPSLANISWIVSKTRLEGVQLEDELRCLLVAMQFDGHQLQAQPPISSPQDLIPARGFNRLEVVASALEDLGMDKDPAIWMQIGTWVARWNTANLPDYPRVSEKDMVNFWALPSPPSSTQPRLVELCQDPGPEAAALANTFFVCQAQSLQSAEYLLNNGPQWLWCAFLGLNADADNKAATMHRAGGFPGELRVHPKASDSARIFAWLWSRGVRPPPDKAQLMADMASHHSPAAISALQAAAMEASVGVAAGSRPSRRI